VAGEIGGDPVDQRRAGRGQRRPDRAAGTLDHRLAPRKADRPLLGCAQPVAGDRLHVARLVGEREDRIRRRLRLADVEFRPGLDQAAQASVLGRRKAVSLRQDKRLPVGMEGLHRLPHASPAGPRPGLK